MKKKNMETTEESLAAENHMSELDQPIWSVITFDRCAADGLTYAAAAKKLEELKAEKVSGLCVVTDETAARLVPSEDTK